MDYPIAKSLVFSQRNRFFIWPTTNTLNYFLQLKQLLWSVFIPKLFIHELNTFFTNTLQYQKYMMHLHFFIYFRLLPKIVGTVLLIFQNSFILHYIMYHEVITLLS